MFRFRMAAVLALLVLVVVSGATGAEQDSFFFIHLTDPQMGFTNGNVDMLPEIEHFTRAVEHINRLKPAFVLITGDMTHAIRDPKQVREFWRIAREIRPDVPLHLLPGNHDMGTAQAHDVRGYEMIYGKHHYSFSYNGSQFILLNSALISDKSDENLRQSQEKWFEAELASAQTKQAFHTFVCSHHPWFLERPDEPDRYQNVPLAHRGKYLDLMDRYGVKYALLGHLHHELTAQYRDLTLLAAGPLSKSVANPPVVGLTVVKVYRDRVEHQFHALDKVPDRVSL